MEDNKKAAIVILNWNGSKMMQEYLPNVVECSRDEAEVIIADNDSTDDSLQMLGRDFPQLRTIVLDRNYGFAEG
ncbi:MAG: glycosyltransferase family 2 protein, partial [Prevotella sp.]